MLFPIYSYRPCLGSLAGVICTVSLQGIGDPNYCRNPDGTPTIWCGLLYTSDAADDLHCVDLGGSSFHYKKKA